MGVQKSREIFFTTLFEVVFFRPYRINKLTILGLLILRGENIDILRIRVYRAITDQDGFCQRKRCENTFQNRNNIFRTTTPSSPMNGVSKKISDLGLWRILGCGRVKEGGYDISMTPKYFHFTFSPSVKSVEKPGPTAQPGESII